MPSAALIIALLAPPPIAALPSALPALTKPAAVHAESWREARLTNWGAQVRWDDAWGAFVAPEIPNYAVVPVWERFETPSPDAATPAPSYVVMREMDCGQHLWRTTGVVSFPAANLEGQARFEPSREGWRSPAEEAEAGSIYGSVCRR